MSNNLEDYKNHLNALHERINRDLEHGPEYDQLLDKMDRLWVKMTKQEKETARAHAVLLYEKRLEQCPKKDPCPATASAAPSGCEPGTGGSLEG